MTMTVDDVIHAVAGFFIILSLALGVEASPIYMSKYWLWFTAFVGANLLQYGFSKFCPMGTILRAFGIPDK